MDDLNVEILMLKMNLDDTNETLKSLRKDEKRQREIHLQNKYLYKRLKILYWNHPELRLDDEFIITNDIARQTYLIAKNNHLMTEILIKKNKRLIKIIQRNYQRKYAEFKNGPIQ